MSSTIIYSEPQLNHYNYDTKKVWFVSFEVKNTQTGERKRLQFRGHINYSQTKRERLRDGLETVAFWRDKLKGGWSPWEKKTYHAISPFMPLNEALEFSINNLHASRATIKAYSGTARFCKSAAIALGINKKPIGEIKKVDIKMIMEHIKVKRKWSDTAYNRHLGYLGAIIGNLDEWDIIEYNPVHKLEPFAVPETQKYIPITKDEKDKIREYLYIHHYRFYVYLMVIYQTGIRPKEVLALKVRDINLSNEEIVIYPDKKEENSKTKNIRRIPINEHLLRFFSQMELHNYPQHYYLFGSPFEKGKGNKGSVKGGTKGALRADYFMPSETMVKRDTTTKLWHKIIKGKLGIEKYQYAMKHTGCDDKLLAGIDIDSLKELYGHSSKQMTEKYATVLKKLHYKEIKEKSPAF